MAKRSPARSSTRSGTTRSTRPARAARPARQGRVHLVFGRRNYVLLLGSVALIVLGYTLMAFDNARGLDARGVHLSLDSALSLTVVPILLLAGYLGIAAAILWRPRPTEEGMAPGAMAPGAAGG